MKTILVLLALAFTACVTPTKNAGRCTTPDCRDTNPSTTP